MSEDISLLTREPNHATSTKSTNDTTEEIATEPFTLKYIRERGLNQLIAQHRVIVQISPHQHSNQNDDRKQLIFITTKSRNTTLLYNRNSTATARTIEPSTLFEEEDREIDNELAGGLVVEITTQPDLPSNSNNNHSNHSSNTKYRVVCLTHRRIPDYRRDRDLIQSIADKFVWKEMKLYEKLDGHLATLYWYNNKWNVASASK